MQTRRGIYIHSATAVKHDRSPHQGHWEHAGRVQWEKEKRYKSHRRSGLYPVNALGNSLTSEPAKYRVGISYRSSLAVEPRHRSSSAVEPRRPIGRRTLIKYQTRPSGSSLIMATQLSTIWDPICVNTFDGHNFKLLLWYRYPGASTSMDINYSEQMTWSD